jgi:hypothetical protein
MDLATTDYFALAASDTSYTDPGPFPQSMYCYQLAPVDAAGTALATSDMVCAFPNSAIGTPPARFTLRLNQTRIASMSWDAPAVAPDAYALVATPLDATPQRVTVLAPDATSTTDNTGGVVTCYQLITIVGPDFTAFTDLECAVPDASTGYGPALAASASSVGGSLESTIANAQAAAARLRGRAPTPGRVP